MTYTHIRNVHVRLASYEILAPSKLPRIFRIGYLPMVVFWLLHLIVCDAFGIFGTTHIGDGQGKFTWVLLHFDLAAMIFASVPLPYVFRNTGS